MKNSQLIAARMEELGITEPSHTFAHWKSLGFSVKKGEKAAFQCVIWKHRAKQVENEDGELVDASRMFMKKAHFFTLSQVEPTAARG